MLGAGELKIEGMLRAGGRGEAASAVVQQPVSTMPVGFEG